MNNVNNKIRLINWTNIVSIHQIDWMLGLVDLGYEVVWVVDELIFDSRRKMGWHNPKTDGIIVVVRPNNNEVKKLIENETMQVIHLFGAFMDYSWGRYAFKLAKRKRQLIGLISEASDPDGIKAPLRILKHKCFHLFYNKNIQFILAMGELGINWFKRIGYSSSVIFPFGYFVDKGISAKSASYNNQSSEEKVTLTFIGSLIKRKRVDYLLQALANFSETDFELIIVGDGPEKEKLQGLARNLKINDSIKWLGYKRSHEIRSILFQSDLLILPSRFDGWGTVVNESILCGTPVICSDHCGAKDLLRDGLCGSIFERNNQKTLIDLLSKYISKGKQDYSEREKIIKRSRNISGASAAHYLDELFMYILGKSSYIPTPPWTSLESK